MDVAAGRNNREMKIVDERTIAEKLGTYPLNREPA